MLPCWRIYRRYRNRCDAGCSLRCGIHLRLKVFLLVSFLRETFCMRKCETEITRVNSLSILVRTLVNALGYIEIARKTTDWSWKKYTQGHSPESLLQKSFVFKKGKCKITGYLIRFSRNTNFAISRKDNAVKFTC